MHGIEEIIAINNNAAARTRLNAADPGRSRDRAADENLSKALDNLAEAIVPYLDLAAANVSLASHSVGVLGDTAPFPPMFSIVWHAEEAWVLPLNARGLQTAEKAIPPGTRRYGLHYILEGEEGLAIAHSLAQMA